MKKLAIAVCLTFQFLVTFGQQDSLQPNVRCTLTLNVFTFVDPIMPRWRVGCVKTLNEEYKISFDIGFATEDIIGKGPNKSRFNEYKLWECRGEAYRIYKKSEKVEKYFSVEYFYIHHAELFLDGFFEPLDNSIKLLDFDQVDFVRQKFGLHLKRGSFRKMRPNFGFNLFYGIGFRVRNNEFNNVVNPRRSGVMNETPYPEFDKEEGVNYSVNFTLGLKLFYVVKKL